MCHRIFVMVDVTTIKLLTIIVMEDEYIYVHKGKLLKHFLYRINSNYVSCSQIEIQENKYLRVIRIDNTCLAFVVCQYLRPSRVKIA